MMDGEKAWMKAIEQTLVVRFPRQRLATFGTTTVAYYVITEPVYQSLDSGPPEGVVRTGRVMAERPAVITPTYAMSLQGFSQAAYEYLQHLADLYGANSPGIMYTFKNESEKMDIVGGMPGDIARRISDDLDRKKEDLSVVMIGVDELWDVALLKFIYEFSSSSLPHNVRDLGARGLLEPQAEFGGVPGAAIQNIESLFRDAERGNPPDHLKRELDRWGLYQRYEDRFLDLFRRQKRGR